MLLLLPPPSALLLLLMPPLPPCVLFLCRRTAAGSCERKHAELQATSSCCQSHIPTAFQNVAVPQDRCGELREEVRWHEAQQLNSTAFAAEPKAKRKPQTSTVQ
jgi:hypothetical protein